MITIAEKHIKKMSKEEKKVINTKEDLLVQFVLDKLQEGETYWKPIQERWAEIKKNYAGLYKVTRTTYGANVAIPYLKKVIRNKNAHFMDILLSRGAESFDLNPGEETDEKGSELLRGLLVYDLNLAEVEKKMELFLQSYETYGYGVVMIPWKFVQEKQKTGENTYKDVIIYDAPDIDNVDIMTFISDPFNNDLTSWKIFKKENVPATYLRQKEKEGIYINIAELKETNYPDTLDSGGMNIPKDSVELLEFHGLVPQKLIEGKLNDTSDVSPFEDDYVWSIITLANRKRIIRAAEYPYWCGNIFVPIWKDKHIGDNKGTGTGEDLSAIVPLVTNLYNKLTDIVNQTANNMYEIVLKDYMGNPDTVEVRAGKFFPVKKPGTIVALNTTGQSASLAPLYNIISMFEKVIEELTSTPKQVMPAGDKTDVHSTASGLMQMTQQAMLPIQNEVKNNIEPAFKKIIEIMYKHNIQFFKKANAIRVLGKAKAEEWDLKEITRSDIVMKGNPDFIPTGVSGFNEKMSELKNLLTFLDIAMKAVAPAKDVMGNPQIGGDGKPIVEPIVDIREIVKRIADRFMFKDLEKLIPSLQEERERKAIQSQAKKPQPNVPALGKTGGSNPNTPPQLPPGSKSQAQGVV